MVVNRVDATLSPEDQKAVLEAIRDIRDRLPFLTDLTTGERQALPKVGEKGRAFIDTALEVAEENPDMLPDEFDVEGLRRDIHLYDKLQPILFALMQLQDLVLDTTAAVSGDAYSAALEIHEQAKAAGKSDALDELLEDMEAEYEEARIAASSK